MAKKVTMKDIARKLGISVSTVSVALNNKPGVNDALRDRVFKACQKLSYDTRKITTKGGGGGGNIGFVVANRMPLKAEMYYTRMFMGAEPVAEEKHYHLLMNSVSAVSEEGLILPRCFSKDIKGLLIAGYFKTRYIDLLAAQGVPVVLLEYDIPSKPLNAVKCENYMGAFDAVKYLVRRGHRAIGLIGGVKAHHSPLLRILGYWGALHEAGLPANTEIVVENLPETTIELGYKAATEILARKPRKLDALFCITDNYATGCMKAIQDFGLRIPEDISVVGFDDMEWASHLTPPLTTVRIPKEAIGRAGLRRAIELIESGLLGKTDTPARIVLPANLVERSSVADRRK
ncbi:MAG: LacI family DNA-binding transcriptional regulator [Candidatus Sumerlaeota bacterium]|nr:LacI family DNA-binding transcriptional regulator [Candidatus Sumerlaeota bacterium]